MAVNTKVIKTKEPALKRFLESFTKFFKDLKAETKRITWPSKEDTKKAVIAAFVFCFLLMAYISILDAGFLKLYNYFFAVK
jgi:preprotein translocase subunit SecE